MTVVVGYVPTPQGNAALDRAVAEASRGGERLIVVNSAVQFSTEEGPISAEMEQDALRARLDAAGISSDIRQLAADDDAASVILSTAQEVDASLICIGIRRRSPVGKLLLGSSAQRIILGADCPVIAIKA